MAEIHIKYLQTISKIRERVTHHQTQKIERCYLAPIMAYPWTHHKEQLTCISWIDMKNQTIFPHKLMSVLPNQPSVVLQPSPGLKAYRTYTYRLSSVT